MNENGGSIPTDSEEWTLHLLDFILMCTKRRNPPPNPAEIYVEQRNKFRGLLVGCVAIEQATLDRECNVALAKWNAGIVA